MSVSLSNSKEIIANTISRIQANGTVQDLLGFVGGIEGNLTPEQIQTASDVSNASNNDPHFLRLYKIKLTISRTS